MPKTFINPEEIKATSIEFSNLKEQLLSLSQLSTQISGIDTSSSDNADAILALQQELSNYDFDNMIARITEVEKINIKTSNINQSTEKAIVYNDDGTVFSEEVTGDMNYKIEYEYDIDGNKISETHYEDNVQIGSKSFTYTNGQLTNILSVNADKLQLIYNDKITSDLRGRIESLEQLDIGNRIVAIEDRLLLETDFDTFSNTLKTYEERLQTLEQFLSSSIKEVYDVVTITERLNALESKVFEGGHVIDEFVYQGENTVYELSRIMYEDDNIRVELDGIELSRGTDSDYSIDGNQLTIHVNALKDSKITVEVF